MAEKPTIGLSADADKLLDIMLEEFRKQMAPGHAPEEWRAGIRELIDAGLARIYQNGDQFSLKLTPEAQGFPWAEGTA